ncbi:cell division inhibitor [Flavobacterium sp. NST-5]|uniref:Cell division inhibitor n=1 Tax=Flavobacterium ichthyis TaxID=2698827 RepID=A0ABW9ZAI6_9FLAO|nr:SRPBCC family protein [Flavobacterium ichthyis]NBL65135.1 cell division inhibitor [Flavobacterium ichthyis]
MALHSLHKVQRLPITMDEAWEFISNPKNLQRITPDSMGFKTISGDEKEMFAGQIIHYKITPIFNISMEWVTEITHVNPKTFFVDEQRFGPYAFWHHKHFLREIESGVEMEDTVHYKLPMGFLGDLFHPILVKPKLEEIFNFREKTLVELFGKYPG